MVTIPKIAMTIDQQITCVMAELITARFQRLLNLPGPVPPGPVQLKRGNATSTKARRAKMRVPIPINRTKGSIL
jgi:hypothetical protein